MIKQNPFVLWSIKLVTFLGHPIDILNGTVINQSVITLERQGCDKRKKHLKPCKESAVL